MAHDSDNKSAAELQHEIELQRSRLENTIDEIQQKLSPGQMVDELLAYTKGGSGEFVASLQRNITANPLPVALLGVSLAWLMAKPGSTSNNTASVSSRSYGATDSDWDNSINSNRGYESDYSYDDNEFDDYDYPVATISGGGLQRLGQVGEGRDVYTEFSDDAGKKFRARANSLGHRASHFTDEAGNRFKGFADATGNRIDQFRDEAGNLLEEATGWASHTWQKAREKLHDARDAVGSAAGAGRGHASNMAGHVGHAAGNFSGQVGNAAGQVGSQFGSLNQTIMHQFRDQPLVGGALAFALGAALGAALPHTAQEDALMGEAADALKGKAAEQAAGLYEQGKEKVTELHDTVASKGADLYQQAKDGLNQATNGQNNQDGDNTQTV